MLTTQGLLSAAALLLLTIPASNAIIMDPGAWLANQLGLDNSKKTAEAIALNRASSEPPPAANSVAQAAGPELMAKMDQLVDVYRRGLAIPVFELSQRLINEVKPRVESTKSRELSAVLADLYQARFGAHWAGKQLIEASMEAQRMKRVCELYGGRSAVEAQRMIQSVEQEMARSGPRAVLGLPLTGPLDPARIKETTRKYMRLLHPDKNGHLDQGSKAHLESLFKRMMEAQKEVQVQASG